MRTKRALQNIVVSLLMGLGLIIVSFIAQKVFVDLMGLEYLGINALLTNVVAMLAVAELGLGSAIIYHLYASLHKGDVNKTAALMQFYKKGYRVIALIVVAAGLMFLPFLSLLVGEHSGALNIYIAYGLFVGNAAVSYLLAYKRSLLYADQKNYIINTVHFGALVILNVLQIWVLVATQNYYLYLGLRIIMTLLENAILGAIVDRRYPLPRKFPPISKDTRSDIFEKVRGLIYHKVAGFVVLGSTSIIISSTLGIITVGLYSNYLLIQTALYSLFVQMSVAIRASVGNLLVAEGERKTLQVFNRLYLAGQVAAVACVAIFLSSSESFVTFWLGENFVLSLGVTVAMALNMYLYLIRWVAFHNFKEAAGIFYEDRFVPVVEACINIVASLIFIHFFGLAGAFLGTALSSLALHAYSYPKFVYKGILRRSYREYAVRLLRDFFVATAIVAVTYLLVVQIHLDSVGLSLALKVVVSAFVSGVLLTLVYGRTEEFIYFRGLALKSLRRTVNRFAR